MKKTKTNQFIGLVTISQSGNCMLLSVGLPDCLFVGYSWQRMASFTAS